MVEQSDARNQSEGSDIEIEIQQEQVEIEQMQDQNSLARSGHVQVVPQLQHAHARVAKKELPPVDWKQPSAENLREECLKWFTDYTTAATHDNMSDDDFQESLEKYISLGFSEYCDESFSKLAAMHKYPEKIVNKEDTDLLKESAYFVKNIIKPSE